MKGRMKKAAAAAVAVTVSVSCAAIANAFGGTTTAPTPTKKEDTALYWATKAGSGWSAAPGVPLVLDDEVIYTSGKTLCALDKTTGKKLDKTGTMVASTSYGITAPIHADGEIIVSLGGGIIQAFDDETFESLWVYTDPLGGQSNSEITYSDGYVYTGFWNGETKETNFVCVPTKDTDTTDTDEAQTAAWTYTSAGGFYWAGAYVTDDKVIVGTDDGTSGTEGQSSVLVFDKEKSIKDGEADVITKSDEFTGDLRSAVSYDEDTGYYFITSKAKKIYRFKVSEEGKITDVESIDLSGMSTSTPIAANGRVYIGVSGSGQFTEYSGAHIAVIDAKKFEIVYTLQTNGYCQSSALISTKDGGNNVYFTANYTPGKVYAFYDEVGMTEPLETETVDNNGTEVTGCCPTLFTPVGEQSQYCLTSLFADDDGTLYFKNDSCYIMALGSRVDSLKVDGKTVYREGDKFDVDSLKVTAVMANETTRDVTKLASYDLDDALTTEDTEIAVSYDGMLYGDTKTEVGHEYDAVYGIMEIAVLPAEDYDAVEACIKAIDAIGEVTLDSKDTIEAVRKSYDAIAEKYREYVTNYTTLTAAEDTLKALEEPSSSDIDSSTTDSMASSSDIDSSTADSMASSSDIDSSETDSMASSSDIDSSTTDSTTSSSVSDSSTTDSTTSNSGNGSGDNSNDSNGSNGSASSSSVSSASNASSSTASNASSTASKSAASSASDAKAAGTTTANPSTGSAAAASAGVILLGALITVSRKRK